MRALVDLLLPPLCDGCGVRAAPPWCDACGAEAVRLRPSPWCSRCAGPDVAGHACWDPEAPVRRLTAVSRWTGPVAATVLHAKLAGRREVLVALGALVAGVVEAPPAVVVPVPTDPRRARQRGLDHTWVLAASVARSLGVPVRRAIRTGVRLPDRGSAAVGDRRVLPSGAFVPTRRSAEVVDRSVLLVDDLVTTGATLVAAARTLRRAGAATVDAAVVARAGAHRLGG